MLILYDTAGSLHCYKVRLFLSLLNMVDRIVSNYIGVHASHA